MISETALLESPALRSGVLDHTDVLDRVKVLSLLPDGMHVTTAMVATYFEVGIEAIKSLVKDHRAELEGNGYRLLTGEPLRSFKNLSGTQSRARSVALFSRRAVLNVAMLLRDSEVARQVRVYLLDMEYLARTQPVENPTPTDTSALDARIDQRITHILGRTVVPMFNSLIANVAGLMQRDGCVDVVVRKARTDRGIDITGCTADGRTVAVQCKNRAGRWTVPSADMQKFAGAARAIDPVDIALFVATCNFTHESEAIAKLSGVITVNRDELEAWSAGVRLKALR
ncbi:restriction endonuclease [Streptomyces sp. NPDC021969]|uniref:restriction endonuclease n=1 Tax=unclassified Streptomyces TaxID=2593676 RepID=UPI0033C91B09